MSLTWGVATAFTLGVISCTMNVSALNEAVKAAGGRKALADSLGVSVSSVVKWLRGEREIRPDRVLMIEAMYGIPRERLLPSLFRRGPTKPRVTVKNNYKTVKKSGVALIDTGADL